MSAAENSWKWTSASSNLWFLNLLDHTHTWVGPKAKTNTNKCLPSVRQTGDDVSPHPVGFASPTLICSLLHTTRIITQTIAAHSSGTSPCCWKFAPRGAVWSYQYTDTKCSCGGLERTRFGRWSFCCLQSQQTAEESGCLKMCWENLL